MDDLDYTIITILLSICLRYNVIIPMMIFSLMMNNGLNILVGISIVKSFLIELGEYACIAPAILMLTYIPYNIRSDKEGIMILYVPIFAGMLYVLKY